MTPRFSSLPASFSTSQIKRAPSRPNFDFGGALILVLCGLAVFGRAFGSEFVFDSTLIVRDDPRLQAFSFANIQAIFTEDYWWPVMNSDLYRPITTLSFFIERAVLGFGTQPVFYQLTNLILHLLVVCLGFRLLPRLGLTQRVALVASAWFLVHPYSSEVVPNVVGRADLFAMLGILGGLKFYLDWLESPPGENRQLAPCAFAITLACLAKENAFSGVAICLWHAFTLGRETARSKLGMRPFRTLATVFAIVVVAVSAILVPKLAFAERAGSKHNIAGDNPLVVQGIVESRINASALLGDMVLNTVVPFRVAADYSDAQIPLAAFPPSSGRDWSIVAVALLTLGFGIWALTQARRRPQVAFFLGASFLALLPISNLVVQIGTIRADRLVYPAIWFMAALAISSLGNALRKLPNPLHRPILFALAAAFLAIAVFTHFRCVDWRTNRQFWQSAYEWSPDSYKTKLGYGSTLVRDTNETSAKLGLELVESSIQQINANTRIFGGGASVLALQITGESWLAFARNARAYGWNINTAATLGRAEHHLRDALNRIGGLQQEEAATEPSRKDLPSLRTDATVLNLAECLRARGAPREALQTFERFLKPNRFNADYQSHYGWTLAEAGLGEEAEERLLAALILEPTNQQLSKEIAFYFEYKTIPRSKAPLSTKEDLAQTVTWPLLDIVRAGLEGKLRAAALALERDLDASDNKHEAARLRRSLRSVLKSDPISRAADPADAALATELNAR